ncbi:hypothetical protein AB4Y45_34455 [Paraburkholderia sp. EG287A]|uniref:hypothetical protein n=1 Tax=Paraburkholderia sp. EG287A TaxID=3237012 RepID=UPI0034D19524
MHDEAILTKGTGKVAATGGTVTIDAVEKVYKSSAQVKANEAFQCADQHCGVSVIAVITQPSKLGRKKSPSSHFRAASQPHKKGCTRKSRGATPPSPSQTGSKPASPTKGSAPTKWNAPTLSAGTSTTGGATTPTTPTAGTGAGKGTSQSGAGTSISSSSRIEKFAQSWTAMTPTARASTQLSAFWNPGDSYASAFFDLAATSITNPAANPMRIYRGTIAKIHHGTTGYSLTLTQKDSAGTELLVWVQDGVATSGPSGVSLWSRLAAKAIAIGAEVFVLGQFDHNSRGMRVWYSIPVTSGNDIWIP